MAAMRGRLQSYISCCCHFPPSSNSLLLVASHLAVPRSFIDDSIQMATHLSEQVEQVSEQGWGSGVATAALVVGVGAQVRGWGGEKGRKAGTKRRQEQCTASL